MKYQLMKYQLQIIVSARLIDSNSTPLLILIVFYRIYAEDGAVPSKTPTPGDPFLGRIKARSVPPPHRDTAKAVKLTIARVENINTIQALVSTLHRTTNHPWVTLTKLLLLIVLLVARDPHHRTPWLSWQKYQEAPWNPMGGVDLRMLQSLIQLQTRRSDIVRQFNTFLLFFLT